MTKTIGQNGDWSKGLVEWTDKGTVYLSVVFSWQLQQAYQRAVWLKAEGYAVVAGGPAVRFNPDFLSDVASVGASMADVVALHNPNATFTSRGCVRRCSFCLVWKVEGELVELSDWPVRPIVCDNNLLACTQSHFDSVVDKLKPLSGIDFNQGLDARLLTKHHADRLAELDFKRVRLAWDHSKIEAQFMAAYELLRGAKIPKRAIRVYVLIGYNDTPEDALYRLESVRGLGVIPNPMRYQSLDLFTKNSYVADGWTDYELKRYMRYWSNLVHLGGIPFDEFQSSGG